MIYYHKKHPFTIKNTRKIHKTRQKSLFLCDFYKIIHNCPFKTNIDSGNKYNIVKDIEYPTNYEKESQFMKSLNQMLLAAKIEYHWWRIGSIRKRQCHIVKFHAKNPSASENLHRYKAEKALIEYEISLGLRNHRGLWTG